MSARFSQRLPVTSILPGAGFGRSGGASEWRPLSVALCVLAMLSGCAQLPESTTVPRAAQVSPVYRVGTAQGTAAGQYAVGRIDLAAGRIDSAIARFRNAILIDPEFIDAYNGLGVAHGLARRLPDALAAFREGLRRAPEAPQLLNNLGYALLEAGEPQQAAASLERSLAVDPSNQTTIENLRLLAQAGARKPGSAGSPVVAASQSSSASPPLPAVASAVPSAAGIAGPSAGKVAGQPATGLMLSDSPVDQTVRTDRPVGDGKDAARAEDASWRLVALGPNLFEYRASAVSGAQPVAVPGSSDPAPSRVRLAQTDSDTPRHATSAVRSDRTPRPALQTALPEGPVIGRSARRDPARLLVSERASSSPSPIRDDLALAGVEVSNGIGAPNLAGRAARRLFQLGVGVVRVSDHWKFGVQRTKIHYREGQLERAKALQDTLPIKVRLVPSNELAEGVNVRLVIGRDLAAARAAFLQAEEPALALSPVVPVIPSAAIREPLGPLDQGLNEPLVTVRSGERHS